MKSSQPMKLSGGDFNIITAGGVTIILGGNIIIYSSGSNSKGIHSDSALTIGDGNDSPFLNKCQK